MNNQWVISGPQIYTEQGVLRGVNVSIHDHVIAAIDDTLSASAKIFHFPENY